MKNIPFKDYIEQSCDMLGVELSSEQRDKLNTHYNLLMKFNKVVNLTALKSSEQIAFRLFADSLLPLRFINELENVVQIKDARILDTGPGGGFPSIPLCILANENVSFTLVERRVKVVFYIDELISSLSLSNISVVESKLEYLQDNPDFSGAFQIAVNKATFPDKVFLDKVNPFIEKGGFALHWMPSPPTKSNLHASWVFHSEIKPAKTDSRFPGIVIVYRKISD